MPFGEPETRETSLSRETFRCRVAISRDEDGRYSAVVLNLPGAGSCGDTREEAIANAREAVLGVIESYRKDGVQIPWIGSADGEIEPDAEQTWISVDA